MKLWLRITQGLAALLLSAAALSLLLFAGALLLGLAALVLVAAAGLFLAAPAESKKALEVFMSRIDEWIAAMKGIVESAGEVVLTVMGAARGVPPDAQAPLRPGADAPQPPEPPAPAVEPTAPACGAPQDQPPAAKPSGR